MPAGCGAAQGIPMSLSPEAWAQETESLGRKKLDGTEYLHHSLIFLLRLSLEQVQITLENGHVDILDFETSYWNQIKSW